MGLEARIKRQIGIDGPMTIGDYMLICLGDPKEGYYTTANPFGRGGDFTTAPEISQMFGELIGVWCVAMWRSMGAPSRFNLVEMGPGRGTLMADLLRAAAVDAGFVDGVQVRLLEISDRLRGEQAKALAGYADKLAWVNGFDDLETLPSLFVGNEFLDALPFRQYVKTNGMWRERMVGLQDGKLAFMVGAGVCDPAMLPSGHRKQEEGSIFEIAPAREAFVVEMADHIGEIGGAGILIDYGHLQPGFGDTFQAVQAHGFADPLSNPGQVDLTSHVDFAAIKRVAESKVRVALATQGRFLLAMGLLERAGHLGQEKSADEQEKLRKDAERLAGPEEMGNLFKVMMMTAGRDVEPDGG